MLAYSKSNQILAQNKEEAEVLHLLEDVVKLIDVPLEFKIEVPLRSIKITTSLVAFEQIMINLINNAIRYNNKAKGLIKVDFAEDNWFYTFNVTDNGIGIAPENFEKIFESGITLDTKDRFNKDGSGIGLCTVKSLVEALGGKISVSSEPDKYTTFTFTLKK